MNRKELLIRLMRAIWGSVLIAPGIYLLIQANIGLNPWDVLHMGIANTTGMAFGTASIIVGLGVMLVGVLMGEHIGLGTVFNILLCGKAVDLLIYLDFIPVSHNLWLSLLMTFVGMFIMCYSQAVYMKEGMGCGPRDTLQVALGKKFPQVNISVILGIILVIVLAIGWLLGGPVGIGTAITPLCNSYIQDLVFKWKKFDPKSVQHQDIRDSMKILFGHEAQ